MIIQVGTFCAAHGKDSKFKDKKQPIFRQPSRGTLYCVFHVSVSMFINEKVDFGLAAPWKYYLMKHG